MSMSTTTTTTKDGETTTVTTEEKGSTSPLIAFLSTYAVLVVVIFIGWVLSIVAWWKLSSNCDAIDDGHAASYRTLNTISSVFPIIGIITSSPVIHWVNRAAAAAAATKIEA